MKLIKVMNININQTLITFATLISLIINRGGICG